MYNRYIRHDYDTYTQVHDDPPFQNTNGGQSTNNTYRNNSHDANSNDTTNSHATGKDGIFHHLLNQLHLDNIDTGDLLLLILLFFLFEEDADDELLIAMGLLLIL